MYLVLAHVLFRLRDMTQETEQEQRRRIAEMEKDIIGLDDLQCGHNLIYIFGHVPNCPKQHNTTLP